jgi:hypothetical protein
MFGSHLAELAICLIMVKPETVIGLHRKGFHLFWDWKVRHGKPGRPAVPKEVRAWIQPE